MSKKPKSIKLADLTPDERAALVQDFVKRIGYSSNQVWGTDEEGWDEIAKELQAFGDSDLVNEIDEQYKKVWGDSLRDTIKSEFSGGEESRILNSLGYAEDDLLSKSAQEADAGADVGKSNYAKFGPGGTIKSSDVEQDVFLPVEDRDTGVLSDRSAEVVRPVPADERELPGERVRREAKEAKEAEKAEAAEKAKKDQLTSSVTPGDFGPGAASPATLDEPAPSLSEKLDHRNRQAPDLRRKSRTGNNTFVDRSSFRSDALRRKQADREDDLAERKHKRKMRDANRNESLAQLWDDTAHTRDDNRRWHELSEAERRAHTNQYRKNSYYDSTAKPSLENPAPKVTTGELGGQGNETFTPAPETHTVPGAALDDIPSQEEMTVRPAPPGTASGAPNPQSVLDAASPAGPGLPSPESILDTAAPAGPGISSDDRERQFILDTAATVNAGEGMMTPDDRERQFILDTAATVNADEGMTPDTPIEPFGPGLPGAIPLPGEDQGPRLEYPSPHRGPEEMNKVYSLGHPDAHRKGGEPWPELPQQLEGMSPAEYADAGWETAKKEGEQAFIQDTEATVNADEGMTPEDRERQFVLDTAETVGPGLPTKPIPTIEAGTPVPTRVDDRGLEVVTESAKVVPSQKSLDNPAAKPRHPSHLFPQGVGSERVRIPFGTDPTFGDRVPIVSSVNGKPRITGWKTKGLMARQMGGAKSQRLNPDGSPYVAPEDPMNFHGPNPNGDPNRFAAGTRGWTGGQKPVRVPTIEENARKRVMASGVAPKRPMTPRQPYPSREEWLNNNRQVPDEYLSPARLEQRRRLS